MGGHGCWPWIYMTGGGALPGAGGCVLSGGLISLE